MLVVLCIVLGNFLGHRAQNLLDEKWAIFSRSLAAKKIEVTRPVMVFARSGLPTLGASIVTLSHTGTSRCFEYSIKAEELFLPLNLSSIFLGRLEFGTLEVEKTRLLLQESLDCNAEPKAQGADTSRDDFEDVIASPTEQKTPEIFAHFTKWFSEHQPRLISMPLRHFYLKQIEIQGETLKEKHLQGLGSLSMDIDKELVAKIKFDKLVLGKTTRSVATQFQAQMRADSQKILISGDWAYYEGHLRLELEYDKTEKVSLSLKSQNLPLSVVNRWFDTPWTFQFVWLNCGLSLQTESTQWQASPWTLEVCKITGPNGEIEFHSKKVTSLSNFNDLSIHFNELQLDRIIKGKEHLPLSGVVKDYGTLNGQFVLNGPKLDGRLRFREPSLLFSHDNKRLLQVLDEMQMDLKYENSSFAFSVPEIKIRGGKFRGSVEAAYYKRQRKMITKILVPQIAFAPEIQNLMLFGDLSPLSVDGDIQWTVDSGEGLNGKLQIAFENYKNSFVSVNKGRALLAWTLSVPQLALTADEVNINRSDSTLWMFASALELETRQQIHLQQVYLNAALLAKNKLDIKKSTGYSPLLGRFNLSGQVDLNEGQGQARWLRTQGVVRDWEWSFRAQDISWIPQDKRMREWLQQHPEYLIEYPFVR